MPANVILAGMFPLFPRTSQIFNTPVSRESEFRPRNSKSNWEQIWFFFSCWFQFSLVVEVCVVPNSPSLSKCSKCIVVQICLVLASTSHGSLQGKGDHFLHHEKYIQRCIHLHELFSHELTRLLTKLSYTCQWQIIFPLRKSVW